MPRYTSSACVRLSRGATRILGGSKEHGRGPLRRHADTRLGCAYALVQRGGSRAQHLALAGVATCRRLGEPAGRATRESHGQVGDAHARGEQYAEFAERILSEIDEQDAALSQTKRSTEGRLSIISPKWIGLQELGLAIGAFRLENPGIRVKLQLGGVSDRLHDFLDQLDIAFHARPPSDSRVKVRRITELPFMLAASSDYLERRGTPASPPELSDHDLLTHTGDPVSRVGEGDEATRLRVQDPAFTSNAYSIMSR